MPRSLPASDLERSKDRVGVNRAGLSDVRSFETDAIMTLLRGVLHLLFNLLSKP
jgi:hypothetical protein